MTAHSKIGASSMYRWSVCPGSVSHLIENPMPTSSFAEEGTLAHDVADAMLNHRLTAINPDPLDQPQIIIDCGKEMRDYVYDYFKYCLKLHRETQGDFAIEQSFHLKEIDERAFGTNDFSCWKDFEVLHIVDLKYGMGLEVQAEGNKQLMYYALGCVLENDLDVNEIYLHIVQPRIEDSVKVHKITYDELMEFKVELIEAIEVVDQNPEFKLPGSHCKFCNQAMCPAFQEHLRMETSIDTAEPTMEIVDPSELGIDRLMKVYDMIPMIQSYIKNVEGIVNAKSTNGDIDLSKYGKKLVTKVGNRSWKGDIPYRKLGLKKCDVYEQKPLTPAKVGKLIDKEKRDILDEAVQRKETGYKIVSESAKGEAVNLAAPETLTINN